MKPICPFCNLNKADLIAENDLTVVIRDKHPISSGHSLIVLKKHVESFFHTTDEEKLSLLKAIDQGKNLLDKKFKSDGYNIGINDGEAAGQTINHLHIHLIPRYEGDSKDPRGGIRWIFPDKAPYWENNE